MEYEGNEQANPDYVRSPLSMDVATSNNLGILQGQEERRGRG